MVEALDYRLRSPEIFVADKDHRRLTTAALIDTTNCADHVDFLLCELGRARVIPDSTLPGDVVRLNSIVRYRSSGAERMIKLVLPDDVRTDDGYRLSATSMHGAALLGLVPGEVLSWIGIDGVEGQVQVLKVANTPRGEDL